MFGTALHNFQHPTAIRSYQRECGHLAEVHRHTSFSVFPISLMLYHGIERSVQMKNALIFCGHRHTLPRYHITLSVEYAISRQMWCLAKARIHRNSIRSALEEDFGTQRWFFCGSVEMPLRQYL